MSASLRTDRSAALPHEAYGEGHVLINPLSLLIGRRRDRLDWACSVVTDAFHSQLSGNNIVADDHRLEVCGFAVPRLFRNRFLSGVTRTSTLSPVTMYVP